MLRSKEKIISNSFHAMRTVVCLKMFTAWALGGSNSFLQKCQGQKIEKSLILLYISQQMTFTTNSGFLSHPVHLAPRENCLTQASEQLCAAMLKQKFYPHPHLFIIWLRKFKMVISQLCVFVFNTESEPLRESNYHLFLKPLCVPLLWTCHCQSAFQHLPHLAQPLLTRTRSCNLHPHYNSNIKCRLVKQQTFWKPQMQISRQPAVT